MTVHLVIITPGNQQIDKWTDPVGAEITKRFWHDAGGYVFEGGLPQPVREDA